MLKRDSKVPLGFKERFSLSLDESRPLEGMKRFAWSPDGQHIAAGAHDGSIWLWQVNTRTPAKLLGHKAVVTGVAWEPEGKYLASSSDDRTVRLWDVSKRLELPYTLDAHQDNVTSVSWSVAGMLATGSDDKSVRVWGKLAGEDVYRQFDLIRHDNKVLDVSWSPSAETLVSASLDGKIAIWRDKIGSFRLRRTNHGQVYCVAWSKNGQRFATGGENGVITIWDSEVNELTRFEAHGSFVLSLSFSADGRFLCSKDTDVAAIWDCETWDLVASLPEKGTHPYTTAAFHPKKASQLATSGGKWDDELHLWDLDFTSLPNKSAFVNKEVFIVHGHNEAKMWELKNFLSNLGLKPLLLFEQDDLGKPIIEKFETFAGKCSFAFALLTPDDKVLSSGTEEERWRARQNVIMELGWFMAKLGRQRVLLLHKGKGSIEIPSDIYGLLYLPFEEKVVEVGEQIRQRLKNVGLIV